MKIDFYTDNEQKAATVRHFLFTRQFDQMMIGLIVEHDGQRYRVNYMEWLDEARHFLNVWVWMYP